VGWARVDGVEVVGWGALVGCGLGMVWVVVMRVPRCGECVVSVVYAVCCVQFIPYSVGSVSMMGGFHGVVGCWAMMVGLDAQSPSMCFRV